MQIDHKFLYWKGDSSFHARNRYTYLPQPLTRFYELHSPALFFKKH